MPREIIEKKDKKRSSSKAYAKAKEARAQAAKANKGARRRERTGEGVKTYRSDNRVVSRSQTPGVSITLQLPAMRRPKQLAQPWQSRFSKRIILVPAAFVAIVVALSGVQADPSQAPTEQVSAAKRTAPEFKPLKPSAEQASAVKYDGERDLATYTTTFSGVRLTVSQQTLPAKFKNDPKALMTAADGLNAKRRIDTVKGPLYVAKNDKGTDQLAIFAATKTLVLIHTDRELDETSWKSFIELLEEKS